MSIKKEVSERAQNKCELCENTENLEVSIIKEGSPDFALLICNECSESILNPVDNQEKLRCLNTAVWSQVPAVQIICYRTLSTMSNLEWASNLLDQVYFEDNIVKLAEEDSNNEDQLIVKDSNGSVLLDGDSVTLIKDLVVKGANFTAKRGTLVKNISLNGNLGQIEGKVNGTKIVLLTQYLKKV